MMVLDQIQSLCFFMRSYWLVYLTQLANGLPVHVSVGLMLSCETLISPQGFVRDKFADDYHVVFLSFNTEDI